MKVGDKLPVRIDSFVVAQAEIEAIEDGKVYIVIPGTRVVMGYSMSLAESENESTHEQIILGAQEEEADDE